MNDIEKRDLFEQERKIFEAGAQRVDKRTGSVSFLTWPFVTAIAGLIAGEEFLAATFKSASAEEGDAKAAQAGAALQAANDDPQASEPKSGAEDETAKGPAASSDAHAAQFDPTGLVAQPVAHASAGGGGGGRGGGGGDDADSRDHDAHTSIDDSSVNPLSADSHFGSSPFPGGSTLESVQPIVVGDSFGPAIIGSTPPLGTVGTPTNDVAGTIAPVEAGQPALTTVTDTVGTLPSAAPDTSAGQAPGPADTLLALATATDGPIEVPGSATAALAKVATDASNAAAAVHPTAIAGDVIALNDAPPPPANALFTGNQYTHYGVTLSSDIAAPPQHDVSPVDAAFAHDTSVPAVADVQKHAPPPPDIVDTTHPIDHLGHAIL